MSKDSNRFAAAALLAAAAGYIAGVLTAPKSGKETRDDIKNAANHKIAEAEKKLKKVHTELSKVMQQTAEHSQSVTGKAKTEVETLLDRAGKAKDKARHALSSVREGEAGDKDLDQAIEEAEKAIEHLKKYLRK